MRSQIGILLVIAACQPAPPATRQPAAPYSADVSASEDDTPSPVRGGAPPLSTVAPLSPGKQACAIDRGAIVCSRPWVSVAEPVQGLAVGDRRGCAVTSSGALYCWGTNRTGELGLGSRTESEPPTRVPGLARIVDVALEFTAQSCAVDAEGAIYCWGRHSDVPVKIVSPAPVRDVVACGDHSLCAALDNGSIGILAHQLTDAGMVGRLEVIDGTRGFSAPSLSWQSVPDGARFACGIRAGRVACAGDATIPLRDEVLKLGDATSFSGNKYDACVVTRNGKVRCLGRDEPFEVDGVNGAVEVVVAAVGDWACARLGDGAVRCFTPTPGPQTLLDPIAAAAAK